MVLNQVKKSAEHLAKLGSYPAELAGHAANDTVFSDHCDNLGNEKATRPRDRVALITGKSRSRQQTTGLLAARKTQAQQTSRQQHQRARSRDRPGRRTGIEGTKDANAMLVEIETSVEQVDGETINGTI